MAERLNAAVLKTVECAEPSVGSNPTLSAIVHGAKELFHLGADRLDPQGTQRGALATGEGLARPRALATSGHVCLSGARGRRRSIVRLAR